MKKLLSILSVFIVSIVSWCSVTFDFDWAMIERFVDKISYLYANCWSDIEWLQENMTPEAMESMDQTCVASIKAITKIRNKIEKLKWKIWENEIINNILAKIDEIINNLQNSKDQITKFYNNKSGLDISNLIKQMNWDSLIENLEDLAEDYNE